MEPCCDLQVDVNGEETFMVDKRIISKYSGRLRKLFGNSTSNSRNLKVIFHDFPGGAEGFELISRFCYNRGKADINSTNISILHCAAHFMEMKSSVPESLNLLELTEKSLREISFWTWSELLVALKQCQDSLPDATSSGVLEKCLDSLVGRLVLASEASPCPSTSSTDSSGFRFSCDSRSTESFKNSFYKASWWFEDLLALNPTLFEMVTKLMILRKLDHGVISRFLLYYHKSKSCSATSEEKCRIIETVVDTLYVLDSGSISCKNLFGILRAALSSKTSRSCRKKLESMIGSRMDQATLDNLLVPSPHGTNCLYDVNLVLKFVKSFLRRGMLQSSAKQLRSVARLMDSYISEVAPDPCLKPAKFLALVKALPGFARDSHDELYRAIDMYLEVHGELSEEEKMEICCALNHEKLSGETYKLLSQNAKFPSKPAQLRPKKGEEGSDEINVISDDNEKLKAHLQGMQWRVMELESVCKKMQTQMAKVMKSRLANQKSSRSLPKMCS